MNHSEELKKLYNLSFSVNDIQNLSDEQYDWIETIAKNVYQQKAVYTVLVTLLIHKIVVAAQDIRYHQSHMKNGFSGRTIDTQYITPTLKSLGLPSMSESGWLTRSLEQPYPYTLDYQGKINNKKVKNAFLQIINHVENFPKDAPLIVRLLLHKVIRITQKNTVVVTKLEEIEALTIVDIIDLLKAHFEDHYEVRGASRLPVLAIYSLYQALMKDSIRYQNKLLKPLGNHTASDLTSKSAGDIEITDSLGNLFEVLEVKQYVPIDLHMVRLAYDKIKTYNPQRYYILSLQEIKQEEEKKIIDLIQHIQKEHGCQVIINGVIPSLKYSLRIVSCLEDFIHRYSILLEVDQVIQYQHKVRWNELLNIYDVKYQKNLK